VPGVRADGAFGWYQVIERDTQGAGVYVIGGAEILVRLAAGTTCGDLTVESVAAEPLPVHAAPFKLLDDGLCGLGRVADDAYVDAVDPADGLLVKIHLHYLGFGWVGHLEAYVEFWGNYIPEVYGMAKALLAVRETDEAAAAAWDDRMGAVRESCRTTIEALHRDGMLAPEWSRDVAVDLMWTMLSIRNWEQLTTECGWSTNQYVSRMQKLLKRTLVGGPKGA
jgi:hypothetical protein